MNVAMLEFFRRRVADADDLDGEMQRLSSHRMIEIDVDDARTDLEHRDRTMPFLRVQRRRHAGLEPVTVAEVLLRHALRVVFAAYAVGLLRRNDDVEPVGRVHFGLVYVADVPTLAVRVRETTKLTGAFATMAEVRDAYPRLESWSQFILDGIDLLEA